MRRLKGCPGTAHPDPGALSDSCAARTINSVLADPSRYRNQEVTPTEGRR